MVIVRIFVALGDDVCVWRREGGLAGRADGEREGGQVGRVSGRVYGGRGKEGGRMSGRQVDRERRGGRGEFKRCICMYI